MLSEFMREMFIAEKTYDIEMAEIAMEERAISTQLKINLAKSEVKVMMESADVSDLLYLVEEAANDATERQENIFIRMIGSMGNFFITVANSIQKLFTGKNMEKYNDMLKKKGKVAVPKGIDQILASAETAINKTEEVISSNKGKRIATVIAALAAAASAGLAGFSLFNSKKDSKDTEVVPVEKGKHLLDRARAALSRVGEALTSAVDSLEKRVRGKHVTGEVIKPEPVGTAASAAAKMEATSTEGESTEGESKSIIDIGFDKIREFVGKIKEAVNWVVSKIQNAIYGSKPSVETTDDETPATATKESVSIRNDDTDPIDDMLASILI